jgi:hypothetical protein
MARKNIYSGVKRQIIIHFVFLKISVTILSFSSGTLRCKTDQVQTNSVKKQLEMISSVPLPVGDETQPSRSVTGAAEQMEQTIARKARTGRKEGMLRM